MAAASAVAANEHLASEILSRLPVKSVIRLKSSCKAWLSLASHPFFIALHTRRNPNVIVGLNNTYSTELIRVTSLRKETPFPFPPNSFMQKLTQRIRRRKTRCTLRSSCNGLVLFERIDTDNFGDERQYTKTYYLYNPITMQSKCIPTPVGCLQIIEMSIAFDPSRYPLYRLVCFCRTESGETGFMIYSSETGLWGRPRYLPCLENFGPCYIDWCAMWNGTMNWAMIDGWFVSLNMESEQMQKIPLPSSVDSNSKWIVQYFGESRGHLHAVQSNYDEEWKYDGRISIEFEIFEFKSDWSGWFLLYRLDLGAYLGDYWSIYHKIAIELRGARFRAKPKACCFLREDADDEDQEDDTLILNSFDKCLLLNLKRKSFHMILCNVPVGSIDYNYHLLPISLTLASP